MLDGRHRVDVVVDVDLELERIGKEPLQLHGVEENGAVLHRADEDRHRILEADGEQRRLLDAERFFHARDVAAEQCMELRRGHLSLVIRPLHQRREEFVGVEQRLFPEAEIVDADHARKPQL